MIKLTYSIFMSCNILNIFFTYIKIPKESSARYYQNIKERLQKKKNFVKDIKVFLRKKKRGNMVVNDSKIHKKIKNKSLLSIEKKYRKMRKDAL